jgi:hypothetical protein
MFLPLTNHIATGKALADAPANFWQVARDAQ